MEVVWRKFPKIQKYSICCWRNIRKTRSESLGQLLFKRDPDIEGRGIRKQRVIRKAISWAFDIFDNLSLPYWYAGL